MPRHPLHPQLRGLPDELVRQYNECRLTYGTPDRNGYPRLRWGSESYYAHRVAFEQFWRPLEPGERVYRTCGERLCTNVYHLSTDAPKKGRKRRPSSAKLTPRRVRAIREAWGSHDRPTQQALAVKYRVSRSAISLVVRGVTWGDVVQPAFEDGLTGPTVNTVVEAERHGPLDVLLSQMIRSPA